jgi:hypothetical protein
MKKLLLNICCGPCGIYVASKLREDYLVTLFFYNPNIWPKEEYDKRLESVKKIADLENFELIEGRFNQEDWFTAVHGLEQEPEGGARCPVCFIFRLEETANYAREHGYDCFASTLTTGRNKRADVINPLGQASAKKYGVEFIEGDWKKQGGQEQSHKLAAELGLYRQNYCGCKFSVR